MRAGRQEAFVEAAMADLEELASKGSPSAGAVLSSFQPDILGRTMCTTIKCGTLKVGPSIAKVVCGLFPVDQAPAVLARGAWAPSGNRKLNRSILDVIEGQRLMAGGGYDPSAAVREINRALQTAKRSRSTPNWDEITRALCSLFTALLVHSA